MLVYRTQLLLLYWFVCIVLINLLFSWSGIFSVVHFFRFYIYIVMTSANNNPPFLSYLRWTEWSSVFYFISYINFWHASLCYYLVVDVGIVKYMFNLLQSTFKNIGSPTKQKKLLFAIPFHVLFSLSTMSVFYYSLA